MHDMGKSSSLYVVVGTTTTSVAQIALWFNYRAKRSNQLPAAPSSKCVMGFTVVFFERATF